MTTVFISHSHQDSEIAHKVYDTLTEKGINVWLDLRNIPTDADWVRETQEAIQESQLMLLLLSPAALQSPSVAKEYQHFIQQNKLLIPVLIAGSPQDIPYSLRSYQYLDLQPVNAERFEQLGKRVQDMLEHGNVLESSGKKQVTITFDYDLASDTPLSDIILKIQEMAGANDIKVFESGK